jgi:hypothetical protein
VEGDGTGEAEIVEEGGHDFRVIFYKGGAMLV